MGEHVRALLGQVGTGDPWVTMCLIDYGHYQVNFYWCFPDALRQVVRAPTCSCCCCCCCCCCCRVWFCRSPLLSPLNPLEVSCPKRFPGQAVVTSRLPFYPPLLRVYALLFCRPEGGVDLFFPFSCHSVVTVSTVYMLISN